MVILLFIGLNLLVMGALFAVGVYQFMQIDDKCKRRPADRRRSPLALVDVDVDAAELRELVCAERDDEARQKLMMAANVDRFTAESAIERLKKQR